MFNKAPLSARLQAHVLWWPDSTWTDLRNQPAAYVNCRLVIAPRDEESTSISLTFFALLDHAEKKVSNKQTAQTAS